MGLWNAQGPQQDGNSLKYHGFEVMSCSPDGEKVLAMRMIPWFATMPFEQPVYDFDRSSSF